MISWSLNKAGNAVIHTAAGSCFWPMCDIGMFESIQFLHVSPNSSKTGMGEWMHRRRPELTLMNDMHLSQTQRSLELHRLQDLWNPVFIEFLPRCSLTLYIFIAECLSWIDRYQMHVILYIHTMDFHGFPTWSSFPATNLKVSLHHAKSFEKSSESWQVQPTVIIYCLIRQQQVPGAWTHAFDSGLLRLLYKYSNLHLQHMPGCKVHAVFGSQICSETGITVWIERTCFYIIMCHDWEGNPSVSKVSSCWIEAQLGKTLKLDELVFLIDTADVRNTRAGGMQKL